MEAVKVRENGKVEVTKPQLPVAIKTVEIETLDSRSKCNFA